MFVILLKVGVMSNQGHSGLGHLSRQRSRSEFKALIVGKSGYFNMSQAHGLFVRTLACMTKAQAIR
jgi:hypothetical protein